jgi:hypothetical protein
MMYEFSELIQRILVFRDERNGSSFTRRAISPPP